MPILFASASTQRVRRLLLTLGVGAVLVIAAGVFLRSETVQLGQLIAYELRPPHLAVKAESSWVSLGFYDPNESTRPEQLPPEIRARLDSLLDQRVGPEFRGRLAFVHVVHADHEDSTFRTETADFEWRVFEYRVGYAWVEPAAGVQGYVGYVSLYRGQPDSVSIEFPFIRQNRELGALVPLAVARDTAKAHGVRPISVRLDYDPKRGRLLYFLTGIGRSYGGAGSNPVAIVDAHSGRLVELTEYNWIS